MITDCHITLNLTEMDKQYF